MIDANGSNTQIELTLVQVRDSIRSYLIQGNAGHYSIGRLYNYTVTNELAEKEGFASAQEFFSQNFKELAQSTLSRYGAVARQFSEESCRKYGVAKLASLSTYAKVADLQIASGDVGGMPIDVPQGSGAVVSKPFAECSLEDLSQAVKHKRNPSKATMSPPDAARVDFMRESFSRHFAQGARVQLKTSVQGGKTLLTIQGVPLDDMEKLAEALLDGLQPRLVRTVG
jgi:tRNA(Ile)-lysidine synthase TilS/MesJ